MDYGFVPARDKHNKDLAEMVSLRRNTKLIPLSGEDPKQYQTIHDFFAYLKSRDNQADNLIVGAHATNIGAIKIGLDSSHAQAWATYEDLEEVASTGGIKIPAGVGGSETRFHFKGCRIGSDVCKPFLAELKFALDNPKQVTAPRFFHGASPVPGDSGILEWMGYSFEVRQKNPFEKIEDLVTAFQKAKFPLLDGTTKVKDDDIVKWVRKDLTLKPTRAHPEDEKLIDGWPVAIVPRAGSISALDSIGQCRATFMTHDQVFDHGDPWPKDAVELKAALQEKNFFKSTHPFPIYKRHGYDTFEAFFNDQTWVPFKKSVTWSGSHYLYTLEIPITKPAGPHTGANEVIYNFYPKTGSPVMNFLEDNAAYPFFGQV